MRTRERTSRLTRLGLDVLAGLPPRIRDGGLGLALTRWLGLRLIGGGRFEAADVVLAKGLAARAGDPGLLSAYAMSAHNRGLFEEATARWIKARDAGAADPFSASCLAANLRELGRHEDARALIDETLRRHPDDLMALTEAARLAGTCFRPGDALAFWERAIQLAKPHPDWLQGRAQSQFALGDVASAEASVSAARRRFPAHQGLLAVEGAILVSREDWQKALAFWTDYRRRFPDDPTGWEQLGIAQQGLAMRESADRAAVAPARAEIAIVDDEPMRKLVLRFESIGDSCEMGLVQRRYGAEPLGLFRWNDVALDNLVTALEHRLDGMGEPANTELTTAINGEFFVKDRRWSLGMHTFLFAGHVDADDVYRKMCRRIVYLRGKLLEDLANADKVFVYRSPNVDIAGLRRLHAALRAFGPVTLLGAQPVNTAITAFPGKPVGEIEKIDEDLYAGFLGRPGLDPRGAWDIAFDDWTRIFSRTLDTIGSRVTA